MELWQSISGLVGFGRVGRVWLGLVDLIGVCCGLVVSGWVGIGLVWWVFCWFGGVFLGLPGRRPTSTSFPSLALHTRNQARDQTRVSKEPRRDWISSQRDWN